MSIGPRCDWHFLVQSKLSRYEEWVAMRVLRNSSNAALECSRYVVMKVTEQILHCVGIFVWMKSVLGAGTKERENWFSLVSNESLLRHSKVGWFRKNHLCGRHNRSVKNAVTQQVSPSSRGWVEYYCNRTFGRSFCGNCVCAKLGCDVVFIGWNDAKVVITKQGKMKQVMPCCNRLHTALLSRTEMKLTVSHSLGFGSPNRNPPI